MGERVFERDIKPWYQLPGESDDAYRTFCLFLNWGRQRSLNKLATKINKLTTNKQLLSVEQLGLCAYVFAWTRRAELCERFIDDELLKGDIHTRGDRTRRKKRSCLRAYRKIGKKLRTDRLTEKRKVVSSY